MTRTVYDGINTDAQYIPPDGAIVAGYDDGLYAWSLADWARFPNSIHVHIAVFASTDSGQVLDCEQGNATPAQSVGWVLMRRRAGADPTVYCGRNTWWSAIRAAFQARGVPEPHYWVADYSVDQTNPQIPAGAIALQYKDAGVYDRSVVADYWPGVDPAPIPTPDPPLIRRNDMHADLAPNKAVVFTNPGAVTMQTAHLLLASDFGDATVRVALFSLKAAKWSVADYAVGHYGGAVKIELPPDTNKVNVMLTGGTGAVGLDVIA